jgi:GNAT superfamily N-acetyltransferase
MSSSSLDVHLSTMDEERFGIRTAKASQVSATTLPALLDFCQAQGVTLLIARCPTSELEAAQAMEQRGFSLMDTLVYYARSLVNAPLPGDDGRTLVRPVRPGDEEPVRDVAAKCFQGYLGHYHADARLDRARCDEVYTDWAYRSCVSREVADEVLVAEIDGAVAGFATVRLNSLEESEGLLAGVATWARSRGVYRALLIERMRWSLSQGATRTLISTQVTNTTVQRQWTRLGYEPSHSYYTFHRWFS